MLALAPTFALAFSLPGAPLLATPAAVVPALDWSIFADPSQALIGMPMSEIETITALSNAREDFGGVVGGSYALIDLCMLATGVATVLAISGQLKKSHLAEQLPVANWNTVWPTATDGVAAAGDWSDVKLPSLAEMEGLVLPSLDELRRACVLITTASSARDLVLCTTPTRGCKLGTGFSQYYGEPVYVCNA